MIRSALIAVAFVGTTALSLAGDWPAFRGAAGDGVASDAAPPLSWSSERNIRWKAPLPGPGNSSPIVVGRLVFLTCATEEGKNRSLHCFSRESGEQLWVRTVRHDEQDLTHKTNPYCGSSPAADARNVVVWHGSAGVYCYDHDGTERWRRDLGTFKHIWGYGSSPVLYEDKVLLNCGPGERTFVTALNLNDGKTIWQVDEPGGASGEKGADTWTGSWSTPVVARIEGRDQVLVSLPNHVLAYSPDDGKVLWSCDGLGKLVYTSPAIGDGIAVAMSGYHGPAMGFKLGGTGNVTGKNRLWQETEKNPQRIGTGIIVGKHLFMANEQQLAQCIDIETGKALWTERMPQGLIWASPVRAGDRLYVTNQRGTTVVFRANPEKFELLSENELGESSNSTLAVADRQIFLRTFENLYCIEDR